MTNTIKVPLSAWDNPREFELPIPDGWQCEVYNMAGYDRPALNDEQIKKSITNPIETPRIKDMAKDKNQVVIIFDDVHRVTRTHRIIPFVLAELAEAGIPDDHIRFIPASGNHAPMGRHELAKKLGEDVMARFRVFNHNCYGDSTYAGTTTRGTKVNINAEVMSCDLKIAIGSIVPHINATFGGGAKKILPGVAHIDTVYQNHNLEVTDKTNYENNEIRLDMVEAARLAGLDMIIDCIVNYWGDTVAIYAGDLEKAHTAGVVDARKSYLVPRIAGRDIVIANAYAKAAESITGAVYTYPSVKPGGDSVLICNIPEGQVVHYMVGAWGDAVQVKKKMEVPVPENVKRLILFTEYPELSALEFIAKADRNKVVMLSKWDDVVKTLLEDQGDKATVAVYPNSDIVTFG